MIEDIEPLLDEGLKHHNAGRLSEALALYSEALRRAPDNARALELLGVATAQSGDPRGGEALLRRAIAINPDPPQFHNNLGKAVGDQGRWKEAIAHHVRATELAPRYVDAWYCLGRALQKSGDLGAAEAAYRHAIKYAPNETNALTELGLILYEQGRLVEAAAWLDQAVRSPPEKIEARFTLAAAQGKLGLISDAVGNFRRLIEAHPKNLDFRDYLIFFLLASPSVSNQDIATELTAYARSYVGPTPANSFASQRVPHRRLRIGYLSSGLRTEHNLLYVMEPILNGHDRSQMGIFLYGDIPFDQATQAPLRNAVDGCCDTTSLDDAAVADRIQRDRIDILVSVLGRGARASRQTVLFRRPAPIQMAFLWVSSTGIPSVDYWIADEAAVPNNREEMFRETIINLPHLFAFQPPSPVPPVSPLPALANGFVTFGSFANTFKLNDELFAAWHAILARVPNSRLVLKSETLSDAPTRASLETRLRYAGLPLDRVTVWPRTANLAEHLARYGEVDIALDTFPYTFGNTALEALWMGVPVVSFAGPRFAHRITLSILSTAGFPDLAVFSRDAYVEKAVELATDLKALAHWRQTARERITISPLLDYSSYVDALEQAYRTAWLRWCNSPQ